MRTLYSITAVMFLLSILEPSAFAWTRFQYGFQGEGGTVTVKSKVAKETDKTGSLTGGGIGGFWNISDVGLISAGLGGVNYELTGRNKLKRFNQKYQAGAVYGRLSFQMELGDETGFWIGPEVMTRRGKGADFGFNMASAIVTSAGGVLSLRSDEFGWNGSLDVRVVSDTDTKSRTSSFVTAGVSLFR